jgi:hypothetical protein
LELETKPSFLWVARNAPADSRKIVRFYQVAGLRACVAFPEIIRFCQVAVFCALYFFGKTRFCQVRRRAAPALPRRLKRKVLT